MTANAPGCFCWIELNASDASAAKAFYTGLFGWEADDVSAGPVGTYTRLKLGERELGGLCELSEAERAGSVPSHWLCFVAVNDADEIAGRASQLGGTVLSIPYARSRSGSARFGSPHLFIVSPYT